MASRCSASPRRRWMAAAFRGSRKASGGGPFGKLVRLKRLFDGLVPRQSKFLIVAPMSGHYATLLRGTVEAFLPSHEVYITDWSDARMVPLSQGRFDLHDYIDYL